MTFLNIEWVFYMNKHNILLILIYMFAKMS